MKRYEPEVDVIESRDIKSFAEMLKKYLIKLSREKPARKIDALQYAQSGLTHSVLIIHSKKR